MFGELFQAPSNIKPVLGANCAVVGVSFRLLEVVPVASFAFLLLQLLHAMPCTGACAQERAMTMIIRPAGSLHSRLRDDNDHSSSRLSVLKGSGLP